VEVLARASLSRYPAESERAWGTLDASDERLFTLGLSKHVAIHSAFPYNRDQMREQTSFDAYPIFFAGDRPRVSSAEYA
jgi:hypothetical protein